MKKRNRKEEQEGTMQETKENPIGYGYKREFIEFMIIYLIVFDF